MKKEYLDFMCCPECKQTLSIEGNALGNGVINSGTLRCDNLKCGQVYQIRNAVPRFVDYGKYANSFGEQWKTFARTQLDNDKSNDSAIRWDSEIGWSEKDLQFKKVVEFGSGAGRFVDVVSKRNAGLAVGVDITDAVDASQENLGNRENVFFVQADFFKLPFKDGTFDFAYSMGVLHHTPNPEGAFQKMIEVSNSVARIGLSLYEISLYIRPNKNTLKVASIELLWAINMWRCEFFRQITTRMPSKLFLMYCKTIVPGLHYLNKVPVLGLLRYLLPSTCYKHKPVEWSMLDTHDTYATQIVHQYRHKDVFQWFLKGGLFHIIVHNGRAGWVSLTGTKDSNLKLDYNSFIHKQPLGPGEE